MRDGGGGGDLNAMREKMNEMRLKMNGILTAEEKNLIMKALIAAEVGAGRFRKEERERGLEKQAETFFKVAERFEKEGKTDLAKKWLEKTIHIAPGSGPAKKAREMLDKLKK